MQWSSRVDPETNQLVVGFRTVIATVVALLIITFGEDIRRLVIDAETSGVMDANTRQDIEIIATTVKEHGGQISSFSDRILKLEFANGEKSKLQKQITMNTNLIRKMQNSQIRMVEKINSINSNARKVESRVRVMERHNQ
ncbi:MAG: hypothetical protein E3J60_04605 [Dehalococcoidia bacterium]|nr:MAG: hypothetical protein E3J60_04605 [Dehalococcoidia bacterium]